jgi:arsenate reductase
MKLYGLKNCDSCKKALAAVRAAGHAVDFIDIRTAPLDAIHINALLTQHGDAVVVNRKSTTWRALDDAARARAPGDLLRESPTLIKRPVIYHDGQSYIGWTEDVQAALLG